MFSDTIRRQFQASDDIRDAGLTTPDNIMRLDDILYGTDETWQIMDLYRPKDRKGEKLPVIVSIHGGGWVYGDKERYQFYCMDLALRGFAVINFTYRLAPEFQFPAPLEDTNLVMAWICAHAEEYGLDLAHIFAVGDSAGAHALGIYCNICTNPAYAEKFSFTVPDGLRICAAAFNCGQYSIRPEREREKLTKELLSVYLPGKGTKEEMKLIDVPAYITGNFPPSFVMTANGDFLSEQAPILTAALDRNAVRHVFHLYGDEEHVLGHVFHCDIRSEAAKICNDDECGFFQTFLSK